MFTVHNQTEMTLGCTVDYHVRLKSAGERFGKIAWAPHCEIVLTHREPDEMTEREFRACIWHTGM